MDQRDVPHDHSCTVCKTLLACEDKFCSKPYWTVCEKPTCVDLYARRTVHRQAADNGVLPCCGKLAIGETAPGDTMTSDPSLVTCKGRVSSVSLNAPSINEPHTCIHDVPLGILCDECQTSAHVG